MRIIVKRVSLTIQISRLSAKAILKQYWGYDAFRPLQEDIINAVLAGHDTLALLPTGGGKSICFQVPALMREGVCIVVSPLIALMKDQVEQLTRRGISAVAIYSGMSAREIDFALDNCVYGNIKFLYVSPERLKTELFLARASRMNIALLAVDEAHCISQWGYDFRPPYLEIADFRATLPDINVIALTATATPAVKQDIQEKLVFNNERVFQKSFARANLSYSAFYEEDKDRRLLKMLANVPGTAIIYVRSRKRTQAIANKLLSKKISADFYHAGLDTDQRAQKQEAWIKGATRVIVATNAFGMGIDKPNVRLVVHVDLPDSLEAYYQEAGRAGRDEQKAYAAVLYDQNDVERLEAAVEQAFPSIPFLRLVYQNLANYLRIAVGSSMLASYDFDIEDFCQTYQQKPYEVYYAIQRLQEAGFIQLNESFFNPSKVHILVSYQELYKFRIARADLEPLIAVLLRMYGGELYNNYITISESQLATQLSTSVNDVMKKLTLMHEQNVLAYAPRKDQPQLLFTTPRYDAAKLPLDTVAMKKRKQQYAEQVASVVHYVTHQQRCRTQLLLAYFGEQTDEWCGVCDNCIARKKKTNKPVISTQDYQNLREQIQHYLTDNPTIPEKLIAAVAHQDEAAVGLTIKAMLDSGELRYDQQGRLCGK